MTYFSFYHWSDGRETTCRAPITPKATPASSGGRKEQQIPFPGSLRVQLHIFICQIMMSSRDRSEPIGEQLVTSLAVI
jgi:hypothetical protein